MTCDLKQTDDKPHLRYLTTQDSSMHLPVSLSEAINILYDRDEFGG
jgi:hypothetical protein